MTLRGLLIGSAASVGALVLAATPAALAVGGPGGSNGTAAPASTGWNISSPPAGTTFTTDADVSIVVDCPQQASPCDDPQGPVTVSVSDPRSSDSVCETINVPVTASGNQLVSNDKLSLMHPYGSSCGALAGAPGYNGTWTITAKDSSGQLATSTFVVKAPPAAPATPSAVVSGTDVTVSWPANPEPDTFAYGVTVDGKVAGTTVKCAFQTQSCTETITVTPGPHDIAVVAARHTTPGSEDYVTGPPSASTHITVAAPSASASPSTHPTSEHPTTTPTGTRSLIVVPSFRSPGLNGGFFQGNNPPGSLPSLGTGPKATASPSLSAYQQYLIAEGPDGTYKNYLPYGTLSTQTTQRIAQSQPTGAFGGLASALGVSAVTAAASVAGGILALLAALHLALWTRRAPIS